MAELRVKGTGTLKLFENDNTSSVTIASPASLGADRTVTLPDRDVTLVAGTMSTGFAVADITGQTALGATPADTDEFVLSDAGVLKRVDYSYLKAANTPYFEAYRSSSQSIANATETTLVFDTEIVDTDGDYDNTTGIFTPQTAGYYLLIGNVAGDQWTNVRFYMKIIKDSTTIATSEQKATGGGYFPALSCSVVAYADGSTDAFKVDVYQNAGTAQNMGGAEFINFGAFKLIA